MDRFGRQLLPCEYDDIYWQDEQRIRSHEFDIEMRGNNEYLIAEKNGINKLIDIYGKLMSIIASEIYFYGLDKRQIVVKLNNDANRYRMYSIKDNKLSDFVFDSIEYGGYVASFWGSYGEKDFIICLNGKYGAVDENENLIIKCYFDRIERFYDNMNEVTWSIGYLTYLNKKVGYYSLQGEKVLDNKYDTIKKVSCHCDTYIIGNEGKFALFNKEFLTDFKFDTIEPLEEYVYKEELVSGGCVMSYSLFIAKVLNQKRCGLIDSFGSIILDSIYDDIVETKILTNQIRIVAIHDGQKKYIHRDYNVNT